jgi:hypothetical protein
MWQEILFILGSCVVIAICLFFIGYHISGVADAPTIVIERKKK